MIFKSHPEYLSTQLFVDDADTEFGVKDFRTSTEFFGDFLFWLVWYLYEHNPEYQMSAPKTM